MPVYMLFRCCNYGVCISKSGLLGEKVSDPLHHEWFNKTARIHSVNARGEGWWHLHMVAIGPHCGQTRANSKQFADRAHPHSKAQLFCISFWGREVLALLIFAPVCNDCYWCWMMLVRSDDIGETNKASFNRANQAQEIAPPSGEQFFDLHGQSVGTQIDIRPCWQDPYRSC